jgi:ABC-type antimicrobial peptide transport system permease subunit
VFAWPWLLGPGGLGVIEAVLIAGLTGAGRPAGPGTSAVLRQRLTTYWLPSRLSLVIVVLLAGLAGVVAAILPSRRAARLNVLRAIAAE